MKHIIIMLGVLIGFTIAAESAQAGFGDALKKAIPKIPEVPNAPSQQNKGTGGVALGKATGHTSSPFLSHRESLIPYTGLGHTQKSKLFANFKEAKKALETKHDACFTLPTKRVENNSAYKVWPSHDETKMQCVKLLDDNDAKACYFITVDCKAQLPGQQEPKPGEWGPDWNQCDTNWESGYRFKKECPTGYTQ